MTDTPDTSPEAVERLADMLERDARRQDILPPEMTGLSGDDEHEIAATLRALAADNAAQSEMVKAQHKLIEELQSRAKRAEANLEDVARRALMRAAFRADAYCVQCAHEIRQLSPAAIVRAVKEGKK